MKVAVNLTTQNFESRYQKKISAKSFKFLVHPPQNDGQSFTKLNRNHLLMANIFKLDEYQTFGLMEVHNMSKI